MMKFEIRRDEEKDGFRVDVAFNRGDDDDLYVDTFGPMDETIFTLFCKALHRMQSIDDLDDSIERRILDNCNRSDTLSSYDSLKHEYERNPQKFTDEIPEEDLKQYLDPDIFKRIRNIGYYHPSFEFESWRLAIIDSFSATYMEDGRRYTTDISF